MTATVSIVRCSSYDPAAVDEAVAAALEPLGGIEAFIGAGDRVLVKPNLLSARRPDEAVTTHPEVIRAVAATAVRAGGKVVIGDSPAKAYRHLDEVYRTTGVAAAAAAAGVETIPLERAGARDLKREGLCLAKAALEVDHLVSVPKFKTHSLTVMTAAIKNLYGLVPGYAKALLHRLNPRANEISEVLADILAAARPTLTVVDAVTAMEGDGPAAGRPRDCGLILAGADPVAVDAVLAKIIGFEPLAVPPTRAAMARDLGIADLDHIEIAGLPLEEATVENFRLPRRSLLEHLPRWVLGLFGGLLSARPVFGGGCTACGLCERACPVEAISRGDHGMEVDVKACIACTCCAETCPRGECRIAFSAIGKLLLR